MDPLDHHHRLHIHGTRTFSPGSPQRTPASAWLRCSRMPHLGLSRKQALHGPGWRKPPGEHKSRKPASMRRSGRRKAADRRLTFTF